MSIGARNQKGKPTDLVSHLALVNPNLPKTWDGQKEVDAWTGKYACGSTNVGYASASLTHTNCRDCLKAVLEHRATLTHKQAEGCRIVTNGLTGEKVIYRVSDTGQLETIFRLEKL